MANLERAAVDRSEVDAHRAQSRAGARGSQRGSAAAPAGESDADWAARLNDAGVIAKVQGNNKKAVAAFTQAIEARSQYYARAANNLAMDSTR